MFKSRNIICISVKRVKSNWPIGDTICLKLSDVKFIYLKALAYIRAANKDLAFAELENASKKDPNNIEVLILKGKLLWSIDQVDEGNEMFWQAHTLDPNHHEVIEFLSI